MPLRDRRDPRDSFLPWRRRWTRQGAEVPVDAAGFLARDDDGMWFERGPRPDLVTLEDLADVPCVVALGDPGLGKSTALRAFVENLQQGDPAARVVAHDLADFESLEALTDRVFRSPTFEEWRDGDGMLHCVLDSFDESPIPVETLRSALLDELRRLPLDRFRFVVACRTAVVPPGFVAALEQMFTPDRTRPSTVRAASSTSASERLLHEVQSPIERPTASSSEEPTQSTDARLGRGEARSGAATPATGASSTPGAAVLDGETCLAVEIAVLSRDDVRIAAAAALGTEDSGEAFLEAVIASEAGAFAARPITLRALLRRYAEERALGGSQVELYRDMCRELCDAVAPRPGAAMPSRAARTSRDERYLVAGRLCASVLFGNRTGIYRGDGPAPSARLVDPANCVGTEWIHGAPMRVTEATIADALNTALFTGVTDDRVLAVHQTFAEFVAADWIVHRGMETVQVLSLLHDPTDPERRIVPQLRQAAAWLAALDTTVFTAISEREPELVLWSDVVEVPPDRRPGLVDALLRRTGQNRVVYPGFGARFGYVRLTHSGLAAQLSPVVRDRTLPQRVRERALEIGSTCKVAGLAPLAADLALDAEEPLDLRVEAAFLVSTAGETPERAMLMPLITDPPPDDESDELRGAALRACWRLLTPDELFTLLVRPRRPNWGGTYSIALREIAEELTPGDRSGDRAGETRVASDEYAVAAARWLARHPNGFAEGPFDDVVKASLLLALSHVHEPDVLAPLLTYVRWRLRDHLPFDDSLNRRGETPPRQRLIESPTTRRIILEALLDGVPGWHESGVEGAVDSLDGALTDAESDGPEDVDPAERVEADSNTNVQWVANDMPELLLPADVPWALGRVAALPAGDPRRALWRDAIRERFDPADLTQLAAAFEHRDDVDIVLASYDSVASHRSPAAAREAFLQQREARRAELEAAAATREASRHAGADRQRPAPLRERLGAALATEVPTPAREHGTESSAEDAVTETNDGGSSRDAQDSASPSEVRWWRVFLELVRDPEWRRRHGAVPAVATYIALTTDVSAAQQTELVDAAVAFLRDAPAPDDPFPQGGQLPWRTLEGCVAAEVVARLAPSRLSSLTPETWSQWLPALVRHYPLGGSPDNGPITTILEAAATAVPEALIPVLIDAVDASARDSGRRVSDPAMALALRLSPVAEEVARRVGGGAYSADATELLLRQLLRAGGRAQEFAGAAARTLLVSDSPPADPTPRSRAEGLRRAQRGRSGARSNPALGTHGRAAAADGGAIEGETSPVPTPQALAVAAAAALIAADEDAGWPILGTRLESDDAFAKAVLLFGARHDSLLAAGALDRLSETRIAALFLLAHRAFPPETDPWHVGVYSPSARDHAQRWRDGLLNALEARDSDAAVDALAHIATARPESDWLVQTWLRAGTVRSGSRWQGTPARRLMRLAERPDARLVETGEQLLDVIVESLHRLDAELQGEWRSVVGLWDQQRRGRRHLGWLPKDEGHLANEVARHLRRDLGDRGILVARELVVQVGIPGGAPGLRTDLDIRARRMGGGQRDIPELRVIMEVKGSWHREVHTAMELQLVNDYLMLHDVRHGLFLVGLYTCPAWLETAEHKGSRRLGDRQMLEATLTLEATRLSNPFRTVRAVVLDASLPPAPARSALLTNARKATRTSSRMSPRDRRS